MRIRLPANNWTPRDYQLPLWAYFEQGGKRAEAIWHRRSGKDEVAMHLAATQMMQRTGNYWHMLPHATQARKAIWEAVNPHTGMRRIDEAFPHELRTSTRDTDMFIRLHGGSSWQVVGSDNFESLIGSPPIGISWSEWAQSDPRSWAFLRPILAENGGYALFITTPRGRNHAHAMYEAARRDDNWFSDLLTVDDTSLFTPEMLAAELKEYQAHHGMVDGKAIFEQEYYCSFEAAIVGSYYADELIQARHDKRIGRVPYDKSLPVDTAWDLGVDDATSIWFIQTAGSEFRFIDYYEHSGVGLDHYAKVLKEKNYLYETHYLPHDVTVRELSKGVSRKETLASLGIKATVCPKLPVADGINATRLVLARSCFDEDKCERGLAGLYEYRRAWNDKTKTFSDRPVHDWASHPADAARSFAIGARIAPRKGRDKPLPSRANSRYSIRRRRA